MSFLTVDGLIAMATTGRQGFRLKSTVARWLTAG